MLFGRRKPGYTTTVDANADPEQVVLDLQKAEKSTVEIYWGIYVGKYKLLTNVPIAVASALSASTIPSKQRLPESGKASLSPPYKYLLPFFTTWSHHSHIKPPKKPSYR